ncbi:MAG TPA: hypothetical protein VJW76_03605 [Verrucomicrobiae bacterium]|nr:hypothetical protein [Verrucomicrobiae bacterium]
MGDETAHGPAEIRDAGGSAEGSAGEHSPLQTRAAFLKNWDWQSVIRHNRGVCERGRAQHGKNSESFETVGREWDQRRLLETTLGSTLDYLRSCHRRAPFLFFNGNTFADIARTFSDYLFAELPHGRRREATSAIAHYVAGVLDGDSMGAIVESLCETADWKPGDRIKSLRGTTHGVIVRLLDDGRVVWRPDGTQSELIGLPESLLREKKPACDERLPMDPDRAPSRAQRVR